MRRRCWTSGRPLPRRRPARDVAGRARDRPLPRLRRGARRTRDAGRSSADGLRAVAAVTSSRARRCGSIRTASSRARAAGELRRLALRGVFGPLQARSRDGVGLERLRAPDLRRRGRAAALWPTRSGSASAPRSSAGSRSRSRLPGRAVDRTPVGPISMLLRSRSTASSGGGRCSPRPRSRRFRSRSRSSRARAVPFVLVYALAATAAAGAISAAAGVAAVSSSGRSRSATPSSARTQRSSATRRRSATSSRATRVSSSVSSTSAGCSRSQPPRAMGACVSETQSPPGAGSPSCSGSARSSLPARARRQPARLRLALAEYAVASHPRARSGCC